MTPEERAREVVLTWRETPNPGCPHSPPEYIDASDKDLCCLIGPIAAAIRSAVEEERSRLVACLIEAMAPQHGSPLQYQSERWENQHGYGHPTPVAWGPGVPSAGEGGAK